MRKITIWLDNKLTVGIQVSWSDHQLCLRLSRPKQANFFGSVLNYERWTRVRVFCVSLQLVPPHYKMSRWFLNLLASNIMFMFFTFVLASNGLFADLLGTGTAHNDQPFWMEKIKHQGVSPFNPNATEYKVFRNVKVGNGIFCVFKILCSSVLSGLWRSWRWGSWWCCCYQVILPLLVHALSFWLMLWHAVWR